MRRTAAVALFAIVTVVAVFSVIAERESLLILGITGALALPIAYRQLGFLRAGLTFVAVAVVLAAVPVDVALQRTGGPSIRILRMSYGLPDNKWRPSEPSEETFLGGCVVPRNAPRFAVVIEY